MNTELPPTRSRPNSGWATYKVPQRFDLATVFVVTFAYAVLLGVLRALGAPTVVQVVIFAALTVVGIVQMVVPLRRVRLAAVGTGVLAYAVSITALLRTNPNGMSAYYPFELVCGALTFGAGFGYICGTVVAGVFLVSDYVRKGIKRVMKGN